MKIAFLSIIFLFSAKAFAQAPAIQWQRSLGGSGDDEAYSIQLTTDGGYIVAGKSHSNDSEVSGNHGGYDYWVVKLNNTGTIQWQKSLGGSSDDGAYSIQQTSDGGYIVAGYSLSNDAEVSGNHGTQDYWIVKLNDTGAVQWQKCLGGSSLDGAKSIQQTTDGGYIVAGGSSSNDSEVSGNHGANDLWVVKLNDTGAIQWQKCLGGSSFDDAESIQQTADGGYIVAGISQSNDSEISGNHGLDDYWVAKLNDTGALQWQRSLGGSANDWAYSIRQTSDGGYIVAGKSYSNDSDVSGNFGSWDYWVVKLNDTGAIQWQKCLGGSGIDQAYSIQQTSDGGYIVAGSSASNDSEVSGNRGGSDYWIVKLNDTGAIQWQKSLGGSGLDQANCIQQTPGGYIVAGLSNSNDSDVSGNHGGADYWVVKLTCGLNAGTITGNNFLFCTDTATLHETVSGGIWSMSNGFATISASGLVTFTGGFEYDTAIYTVSNTCGTVSARFSMHTFCEFAVHPVNNTTTISITPNPTTGSITITGAINVNIKIYNTLGQLINQVNSTDHCSLSAFPVGLYLVRVFNEQGVLIKQDKIIKK